MGAAGAVAKKKTRRGPKPNPEAAKDALIAIRCRQEYKDWLARYAEFRRASPSNLFDMLFAEAAKRDGFEPPPKR